MSETTTLEQLRTRVMERAATLSDEVVSVKSLRMDPEVPGSMTIAPAGQKERNYFFDERIYGQTSSVIYGLPGGYIKKLCEGEHADPGLAALNFNHWVGLQKDKEVLLLFAKRGDDRVLRAMKPASWNAIPYQDSIDTLITKFGSGKEVAIERFDEEQMVLNFITRQMNIDTDPTMHVFRDDPYEWGVRFQDSDVGSGDLQIMPYTRRLVCTNGMTTTNKGVIMHISHSGKGARDQNEVQANVRQGIEMIDGYAATVAGNIEKAQGVELELNEDGVPAMAMQRLEREQNVTRLMQKHVLQAWDKEAETIPDSTVYRLHNALTRAGTHAQELTPDARLHLQGVGGRVLEMAGAGANFN